MHIDPRTGLPIEALSWEDLAKSEQRIAVTTEKRRYGKFITLVSGLDKSVDIKAIAKSLKEGLACGGTVKDGIIELQGNHRKQVRQILVKLGFAQDSIND
ncbi:MAG: stress response translation initiation inhibitor YciH [Nanoarchaeota archaeon]